jgi:hypothetical protein
VFYVLIAVAGLIVVALVSAVNATEPQSSAPVMLALALIVVTAAAMAWLILSVRCRRCGHRPIWRVINTQPATRWFLLALHLSRCTNCDAED